MTLPPGFGGTVFVGRDAELAALAAQLAEATVGGGSIALIAGEPGIGKTRLAEELAARARESGIQVLWGRCYEGEGAPAFWPWIQILRPLLRDVEPATLRAATGAGAAEIAQLVPELRLRLPDLPAPSPLEPAQARFQLFDGVTSLLAARDGGPLVIILDDLHWADAPSLLLIEFLAREIREARLLVLGTYRDIEVGREHPLFRSLGGLVRLEHVRRLHLRGLDEADSARLIGATAGTEVPGAVASLVAAETGGNPFFLTEMVRLLAGEGRLADPGALKVEDLRPGVPAGVREVIDRRLDQLTADCTRVLTVAAVVGREFSHAMLGLVAGLEPQRLLEVLEEAETARIIVAPADTPGRYRFTHALIRETLYDELPMARRTRLHRDVGEALEEISPSTPGPHLAELAHHFVQASLAGGVNKAIEYSRRTGDYALSLFAYEEASRHYQTALQVLELKLPPDEAERCDLLLALGRAQTRTGEVEQARDTARRAATIARQIGAGERLARAVLGLGGGGVGFEAGVADQTLISLLEEALSALGTGDSALRARVLARLAFELGWTDAEERCEVLSREALAMARRVGDPAALGSALSAYLTIQWPRHVGERLAIADEMVQLSAAAGNRAMTLTGRRWRIDILVQLGEVAAAGAEIEALARLAEELRQPAFLRLVPMLRGMLSLLEGRFADADRLIHESLAIRQRVQEPNAQFLFTLQASVLRRDQGRFPEMEAVLQELAEQHPTMGMWPAHLALLDAEEDRWAEARHTFEQLAQHSFADIPPNMTQYPTLIALTQVCVLLGDAQRAALLYDLLRHQGEQYATEGSGVMGVCYGPVARYLGLLAATMSRWERAQAHFEVALALAERMRARPWLARTQHDYAAALLARDAAADRAAAQELLSAALATAQELGMAGLAAQIVRLLTTSSQPPTAKIRAGVDNATAAVPLPDGLTLREVEVLRLLTAGMSNREIAETLVIAVNTVERHLVSIYSKLGVKGRTAAAAYAHRQGLA